MKSKKLSHKKEFIVNICGGLSAELIGTKICLNELIDIVNKHKLNPEQCSIRIETSAENSDDGEHNYYYFVINDEKLEEEYNTYLKLKEKFEGNIKC